MCVFFHIKEFHLTFPSFGSCFFFIIRPADKKKNWNGKKLHALISDVLFNAVVWCIVLIPPQGLSCRLTHDRFSKVNAKRKKIRKKKKKHPRKGLTVTYRTQLLLHLLTVLWGHLRLNVSRITRTVATRQDQAKPILLSFIF